MTLKAEKAADLAEIVSEMGEPVVWNGRTYRAIITAIESMETLQIGGFGEEYDFTVKIAKAVLGRFLPSRTRRGRAAYRRIGLREHRGGGRDHRPLPDCEHTVGPLWKATVVFRLESPAFDNDRDAHDQRLNAIRTWLEDRDAVAFIVTAFSSVAIGNIIGGTLVLAFQEASNFLLSNLLGVFYAVGQYFAETIPNFIALFGIVTTADFWKGMGNALMGIAQGFIALLLDGVAMLLV